MTISQMPSIEFPYSGPSRSNVKPKESSTRSAVLRHPIAERCVVATLVVISVLVVTAVLLDALGLWIII
jgi:hypothetical protein